MSTTSATGALQGLAKNATIFAIGLVMTKVLAIVTHLVIANLAGDAVYGFFSFGLSIILPASVLALLGLHQALIRFGAESAQSRTPSVFASLYRRFSRATFICACIVALLLFAGAWVVGQYGLYDDYVPIVQIMAVALPFMTSLTMSSYAFRAMDEFGPDAFFRNFLRNVVFALLVIAAPVLFGRIDPEIIAAMFVLSFVAAAAVSGGYLRRAFANAGATGRRYASRVRMPSGRILSFGVGMTSLIFVYEVFFHIDRIFLGQFAEPAEVGRYAAAAFLSRNAEIVGLISYNVVTPFISSKLGMSWSKEQKQVLRPVILITAGCGALALLAVYLVGEYVLRLFGPSFVAAYDIFMVLMLGNVILTMSSPISAVLQFRDLVRRDLFFSLAGLGTTLACLAWLTMNGMAGPVEVAWSMAAGMTVISASRIVQYLLLR